MKRRLEFTVTQALEPVSKTLDAAALEEQFRRNFFPGLELREVFQVNQRVALLEDVREAPFRKPRVKRHLPAFEARTNPRAGPRLLPLRAASGGLPVTGAHALPNPLPGLVGASRSRQCPNMNGHGFAAYFFFFPADFAPPRGEAAFSFFFVSPAFAAALPFRSSAAFARFLGGTAL